MPREADEIGVVGKVEPGPHGDFQPVALGLGADPLAPPGEQQPFQELDVLVVVGRLVDTADCLGRLESWGSWPFAGLSGPALGVSA
jgi:hypothetical protein